MSNTKSYSELGANFLDGAYCKNNYFLNKLHLRCSTWFWIRLWNILLISLLCTSQSFFFFFVEPTLFGSSCLEVFCKKAALKIFRNFTGKYTRWSVILVLKSQDSTVDVLLRFFRKFSEQFFCRTPLDGWLWLLMRFLQTFIKLYHN